MSKNWKYLKYLIKHKWCVYKAGRKLRVSIWRLIIHDWSKFRPSEWKTYREYFYGKNKIELYLQEGMYMKEHFTREEKRKWNNNDKISFIVRLVDDIIIQRKNRFKVAINKHYNRNPHHWQYWITYTSSPDTIWLAQSMDGGMTDSRIVPYNKIKEGTYKPNPSRWTEVVQDFRGYPKKEGEGWYTDEINEGMKTAENLARDATKGNCAIALPMPTIFIKEMIADWIGASIAKGEGADIKEWWRKNNIHMLLHESTRKEIKNIIHSSLYEKAIQ